MMHFGKVPKNNSCDLVPKSTISYECEPFMPDGHHKFEKGRRRIGLPKILIHNKTICL